MVLIRRASFPSSLLPYLYVVAIVSLFMLKNCRRGIVYLTKYQAMLTRDLFERRYRRATLLDRMEPFRDDPDVFVTFTSILKLGVHPTTEWSDPIGIYGYPVKEMFTTFEQKKVPFAGHRPYAYLFRNTGKMLELGSVTDDEMIDYLAVMENQFADSILLPSPESGEGSDPQAYWDHAINSWIERFGGGHTGECLWEVTRKIAAHIEFRNAPRDRRMIWNKLFRACGFDAVSDRGFEIISLNEPAQAVFLNTRAIQPIEVVLNDLGNVSKIDAALQGLSSAA